MGDICERCGNDETYGCSCSSQEISDWRADEITRLRAEIAERDERDLANVSGTDEIAEIERAGKRWHGEDHRVVSVRWEPYKPDGQRQMKRKGRWQERVGSGDFWQWRNCDRPKALHADASRKEVK